MHVIGKHLLLDLCRSHPDAKAETEAWIRVVEAATWQTPHQLREWDVTASFAGGKRTIFNIRHNRFRVETKIDYQRQIVQVIWAGTHAEYTRRNKA
jgi:mRNA interferase HigB